MSHTQLELCEDMPAERGCAKAKADTTLPHCCLGMPVCAPCVLGQQSVSGMCTLMCAETASARGCSLVCAVSPVSLCILGSVCCVTTPGQAIWLSNGGFCLCPSHVDVSVGIHTPAMHIYNTHVVHVPGSAQVLPGPAQAFWGSVVCVAMVRVFATVASL